MKRIQKTLPVMIAAIFSAGYNSASVADIQITGSVDSSLVHQKFQTEGESDEARDYQDRDTIQLSPSIVATYTSKKLLAAATANHLTQRISIDEGSRTDSFTEFNYNGSLSIIDNVLQVYGQGSQGYQAFAPERYISTDFLLNSNDLTKTQSHSVGASLTTTANRFVRMELSAQYFTAESDSSLSDDGFTEAGLGIDSTGTSAAITLINSSWFRNMYWSLAANTRESDRASLGSFKSTTGNAQLGYNLVGDLGLIATASHQEYTNDDDLSGGFGQFGGQFNRFTTYGVGLNYRPAAGRFFSITANQISTDGEDDGKTFVGVSTQWQFSPRTRIAADFGRRYYGESGSFSLNYGTRAARASIAYQEATTNYSSLIFDTADAGTFVCPAGAVDIIDCFQPDTLEYELQPGEQVVQFSEVISELTDQVVLRKQLNGGFGFQRRKLKVSIDGRYADTVYSEVDRKQIQKGVGINASLAVGSRTNLTSRIQFSNIETSSGVERNKLANKIFTLGMQNQLSQGLSVNAEIRYLDNDNEQGSVGSAFTLNETRISIGLTYQMRTKRN